MQVWIVFKKLRIRSKTPHAHWLAVSCKEKGSISQHLLKDYAVRKNSTDTFLTRTCLY